MKTLSSERRLRNSLSSYATHMELIFDVRDAEESGIGPALSGIAFSQRAKVGKTWP